MIRRHVPLVLAVGAFAITSATGLGCFDLDDDACESDADCPGDALCDVGPRGCDGDGARCTFRPTCLEDADCAQGETCVIRSAEEAEHPFDEDIPERGFCEACLDFDCGVGGSTFVGSGGSDGAGASGFSSVSVGSIATGVGGGS